MFWKLAAASTLGLLPLRFGCIGVINKERAGDTNEVADLMTPLEVSENVEFICENEAWVPI